MTPTPDCAINTPTVTEAIFHELFGEKDNLEVQLAELTINHTIQKKRYECLEEAYKKLKAEHDKVKKVADYLQAERTCIKVYSHKLELDNVDLLRVVGKAKKWRRKIIKEKKEENERLLTVPQKTMREIQRQNHSLMKFKDKLVKERQSLKTELCQKDRDLCTATAKLRQIEENPQFYQQYEEYEVSKNSLKNNRHRPY